MIKMNLSRATSSEDLTSLGRVNQVEQQAHTQPVSILVRMAIRASRTRWFSFSRRVFQYQNGAGSDLRSNPFNTGFWIALEFLILAIQTIAIMTTLVMSKKENPVWPLTLWISGYNIGNMATLPLLYWRFRHPYADHHHISDVEQQRTTLDSSSYMMNRCRTGLELFFALWFVMGNVWVFDSRFGAFENAPKLYILCVSLLVWNGVVYSFPFFLFLLLCCLVPFISSALGYNMNMGSVERSASDDQISSLPHWKFKEAEVKMHLTVENSPQECCICLTKYVDEEEVKKLPCSHLFHLRCVDQWLRIISCCPLCKHELEK